MSGTDALISVGLVIAMFGVAGLFCWLGDLQLQKRQQDWRGESNSKGIR